MWKYEIAKQEIENSGLKIKWIATRVGIDRTYLSQCLNGAKKPSYEVATRLARLINIPVEQIYELEAI